MNGNCRLPSIIVMVSAGGRCNRYLQQIEFYSLIEVSPSDIYFRVELSDMSLMVRTHTAANLLQQQLLYDSKWVISYTMRLVILEEYKHVYSYIDLTIIRNHFTTSFPIIIRSNRKLTFKFRISKLVKLTWQILSIDMYFINK